MEKNCKERISRTALKMPNCEHIQNDGRCKGEAEGGVSMWSCARHSRELGSGGMSKTTSESFLFVQDLYYEAKILDITKRYQRRKPFNLSYAAIRHISIGETMYLYKKMLDNTEG